MDLAVFVGIALVSWWCDWKRNARQQQSAGGAEQTLAKLICVPFRDKARDI
jgi:hypothetical protein